MTVKQAWRSAWRDVRNRCAGRNTSGRHGVQVARAALVAFDARQREEKAARAAQLLAVPLLPLVLRRKRGGGAPPAPALAMAMALLVMIVVGCGGALEPVKRTLTLQPGAQSYAVTLVYPGLHVHEAQGLLAQDAAAHGERLACAAPQVRLVSALEETAPPDKGAPEGAEPKSTTKVEGLLSCAAEVSMR